MTASESGPVVTRGLRYAFGEHVAVDGLDLALAPGEVFGLLGPNGAGKTTTIRVITTLLPAPPGTVTVAGLDVARNQRRVRRLLGYVPQQLSADASLSGRENVALFARLFDVPRSDRSDAVAGVLDAMGLTEAADRTASTYSGGMIRRLELAQALVSAPQVLVLDEPTVGLDPVARSGVWDRIHEVRHETGMTVLVTTHAMEEAELHCDRVALLHRGRKRAEGSPAELMAALGDEATLDDVFRHHTGDTLTPGSPAEEGGLRSVRAARRTARRVG
ncbi:ABC transporter ATP-binding protein [Actinomycetospora sp. NBRC 106375]|uniref:ABC transporter ATP-binding protein n=1 Tax=Actinomycetospora sp. NBRC 106375 TaxID=3032207 RepID=UPI0024A05264|nr:ATP-binding cassette domain-containing protein [Actinomycetospora sp. NBRC 106375]GLZ46886.1 ABC transporter ATP-binding protein [Actinomycetospora sp. NBRC 106375]